MSEIIWLDENETDQRKQNFAIRQLLERASDPVDLTAIEADITAIESDITDIQSDITDIQSDITALQAPHACFFAHKNGADQTGVADAVLTQVTFPFEVRDVGGHFSSNAWTPPAGTVVMSAAVVVSGTGLNSQITAIYKNGASLAAGVAYTGVPGISAKDVTVEDVANGSDVYTVYSYGDVTSGTVTILSYPQQIFFSGVWVGP